MFWAKLVNASSPRAGPFEQAVPPTTKPNNNDNDNNTSFGKNGLVQSLPITQFID